MGKSLSDYVDLAGAIGSGINAATSIFSSDGPFGHSTEHLSKVLADYQNDINLRNWNLQNEYNTPRNQVKLYQEAGFSPALLQDGNFSPAQTPESSDISKHMANQLTKLQLHQQAALNAAQIANLSASSEVAKEDARSKRIQNDREESYDSALHTSYEYLDWDGNTIDNIEQWRKEHPQQVPMVVVHSGYENKGQMQAAIDKAASISQISGSAADDAANKLREKISLSQMASPEVRAALTNMPVQEFKKLINEVVKIAKDAKVSEVQEGLVIAQKELAEFEKFSKENTSVAGVINAFKDPDMSFTDKILSVLGLAVSVMLSR